MEEGGEGGTEEKKEKEREGREAEAASPEEGQREASWRGGRLGVGQACLLKGQGTPVTDQDSRFTFTSE